MKKALIFILMLTVVSIASEGKVTISIDGMSCNACVGKVTSTLEKIDGVKSAQVTLKPGAATVIFNDQKADSKKLMQAISALGYKASLGDQTLGQATHCQEHETAEVIVKPAPGPEPKQITVTAGCDPTKCKVTNCRAKAKAAPSKESAPEASTSHADAHTCPTINECKELIAFHEAMHPMHEALAAGNYDRVRGGYELLDDKAQAIAKMNCDEKCVTDVKKFKQLRKNLLNDVKALGKAVRKDNNDNLAMAFNRMHETYVELGTLAR